MKNTAEDLSKIAFELNETTNWFKGWAERSGDT
jgi:hypothetical protein